MRFIGSFILFLMSLGFLGAVGGIVAVFWAVDYFGRDLPDFYQLKDYQPEVVTRVHGGDGRLMAEFASERRIFVPIDEVPPLVVNAFLSAEDKNFFLHEGVDYQAIARAVVTNIQNAGRGRRLVGASTITQQVAKNFLVGSERSYERKIKEALVAFRMEQAFGKKKILELYLNEIFLGSGSYGVASAALYYFNKSLDDLQPHEAAYLAALPKAPNNYHPVRDHDAALARRNWVLDRMLEDGHITALEARHSRDLPLIMVKREAEDAISAPYFAEDVRRELIQKFGADILYKGGLSVRTSVDPRLQAIAENALQEGLQEYDRRHGWRGPIARLGDVGSNWRDALGQVAPPGQMLDKWRLAVFLEFEGGRATIGLADGTRADMLLDDIKWTKAGLSSFTDVFRKGDVVAVAASDKAGVYSLRQIPQVQGAIVIMDPHTGRVLAAQGGWKIDRQASEFNRATQAKRQPGSAFKPFIYLAALESGFTPSSRILDAPFTHIDALGRAWSPENYSREYYGPSTLRVGIEKSRNLMTVRLADTLGMKRVAEYAEKFGIVDKLPLHLANSLGSQETTLLRLTNAYAMIVNGGRKIKPSFVDRIQNRDGKTIYTDDQRPCPNCGPLIRWENQDVPQVPDTRDQVVKPASAYQMVSILEGVIQRGTARRLADLPWPLAGKTGTTNDSRDAWFVGFTPDLAIGVFVGFDEPKSLGEKETGGSVAVPIFRTVVEQALKDQPPTPFRIPPGIKQVQVVAETGYRAQGQGGHVIWESFVAGTEPDFNSAPMPVIGGSQSTAPGPWHDGGVTPGGAYVPEQPGMTGGDPSGLPPVVPQTPYYAPTYTPAPGGGVVAPPGTDSGALPSVDAPANPPATTGTGGLY